MSSDRSREEEPATANEPGRLTEMSRRTLFRWGALAGAGASIPGFLTAQSAGAQEAAEAAAALTVTTGVEEASIASLQAAMTARRLSALDLVNAYLQRIELVDRRGAKVNSIIEVNPDARSIARALDAERHAGHVRGPLHGIPVVIKDNIDTADRMQTTAGSLAMIGPPPSQDATVAARLRAAGAILLGKTNLSEWANFRSTHSTSGWSGRGGQTNNPYVLDRNPCGSSSGTGAAVTASFAAAGLGTETDGSIVCPASINGVVGIKPTVGLTSRAGVIPIAHSQDTVGPHGRTVADAAAVLGALVGVDPRDPATAASAGKFFTDYTQFLDPNGLRGARIGVARNTFTGYSTYTDAIFENVIQIMRNAGAVIVDPADIPTAEQILSDPAEINVLLYEFKRDLNAYLASRPGLSVHTLADLIAFNDAHAAQEMPYFGQELFEIAESDPVSTADYNASILQAHKLSRDQGIDAVMNANNLDALIAPTSSPAWPTDLINGDHFLGASSSPAAMAGYPMVNVLGGYAVGLLPVGISIIGTAYSEPKLIKIAYAFEQAARLRKRPTYLRTLPIQPPPPHAAGHDTADDRLERLLDRLAAPAAARLARLHSL